MLRASIDGAAPGVPSGDRLVEVQAAALASVSDAVMITDTDGVIVWVNAAFEAMSGYRAEEAVGATPRLLRSGEHDQPYYRRLWETILAGRRWQAEVVERHKDGHDYRVLQTITPIADADGGVAYFVAAHENLTELRASQARLQALFDHALDGLLLYDDQARMVDANPAVSALLGYTREQMAQMTLPDVVAEEAREAYEDAWRGLRASGSTRGTLPLVHADGQRVEIEFQSVADIVPGVHLSIIRDVTEQRRLQATERFQSQLLEAVGDAVIATDLDGNVRYVNPAAERLYGWDEQKLLGRNLAEVLIPSDDAGRLEQVLARVRHGEVWTRKLEERRYDGTTHTALVTLAPYLDESSRPAGSISVSSDISDLERARQLLSRRAAQQAAVAELGRHALESDEPRAVAVEAERKVNELLDPAFRAQVRWSIQPSSQSEPGPEEVLRVPVGPTGALCVASTDRQARLEADDEEFVRAVAHVLTATVRQHLATSELAHLASHDPLTGLPNRTLFTDRLELARATATRTGRGYAVVFLDLDRFKTVNDSLGHEAGDEALQLVAAQLQGVVRPADTVARFGGDEFAIIVPELDTGSAVPDVAWRMQQALATPFETSHGSLPLTASIGVARGDATSTAARLLQEADAAMYAAKDNGRNRIEEFDTSLHQLAHQRLATTNQLRDALANDQIVVHYQPTIELAGGKLVGVEALVRLRNADGSLLPPEAFIDLAEDAGLIGELGHRVLETACADAADWLASDPDLMVSVNLSPRQFTDPHLAESISRTLQTTGLPATNLWLEITESVLLTGPQVHTTIRTLRRSGVNFAIDDFGTGYSSLAHLRDTPVDALKIDRGFVAGLLDNPRDHALIVASLDLAHAFGLLTLAEGVETEPQRQELTRLGCSYAQGYLWSPAIAAEHITNMLTSPIT